MPVAKLTHYRPATRRVVHWQGWWGGSQRVLSAEALSLGLARVSHKGAGSYAEQSQGKTSCRYLFISFRY